MADMNIGVNFDIGSYGETMSSIQSKSYMCRVSMINNGDKKHMKCDTVIDDMKTDFVDLKAYGAGDYGKGFCVSITLD
jgi:hypothetical protein